MAVSPHEPTMIQCTLRVLLAQLNLERAQRGEPPLSQAKIAEDTRIPPSVINGLVTNRTQRVDYRTLDRLCAYLGVQPGDLLIYKQVDQTNTGESPVR